MRGRASPTFSQLLTPLSPSPSYTCSLHRTRSGVIEDRDIGEREKETNKLGSVEEETEETLSLTLPHSPSPIPPLSLPSPFSIFFHTIPLSTSPLNSLSLPLLPSLLHFQSSHSPALFPLSLPLLPISHPNSFLFPHFLTSPLYLLPPLPLNFLSTLHPSTPHYPIPTLSPSPPPYLLFLPSLSSTIPLSLSFLSSMLHSLTSSPTLSLFSLSPFSSLPILPLCPTPSLFPLFIHSPLLSHFTSPGPDFLSPFIFLFLPNSLSSLSHPSLLSLPCHNHPLLPYTPPFSLSPPSLPDFLLSLMLSPTTLTLPPLFSFFPKHSLLFSLLNPSPLSPLSFHPCPPSPPLSPAYPLTSSLPQVPSSYSPHPLPLPLFHHSLFSLSHPPLSHPLLSLPSVSPSPYPLIIPPLPSLFLPHYTLSSTLYSPFTPNSPSSQSGRESGREGTEREG